MIEKYMPYIFIVAVIYGIVMHIKGGNNGSNKNNTESKNKTQAPPPPPQNKE